MKNGYFKLVCSANGTSLRIFSPVDGGEAISTKEIMEYLNRVGIKYDLTLLNKGVQDAIAYPMGESFVTLNFEPSMEVRECYSLFVSQDRMMVTARFYAPSAYGERMTVQEFINDLSHQNITYGILVQDIMQFFREPEYCKNIIVARGEQPRNGSDAKIEYYFETDLRAKR